MIVYKDSKEMASVRRNLEDNTNKILNLSERSRITWNDASSLTLPSVNDLQIIYKNRDRLNEALMSAGGSRLTTSYGAHYWSSEKYGSASAWTISMYDCAKNSFYRHDFKAKIYKFSC